MPVFRRHQRCSSRPPNVLIIGEDLERGLREPGPPPTQADLDRIIGPATAVAVVSVFPPSEVLYDTQNPSELAFLRQALLIEGEAGHCMCMGTVAFVFRRGGEDLGTVTLHHGESLRWDPFFRNAPLVESGPILDWLSAHEMPGAREEFDDAQSRRADAAEAAERWRAAMPVALAPLWNSMGEPRLEWPEVEEVMAREYPSALERARVLIEWFGRGKGPWSGFPSYEIIPEWCLLRMPLDTLLRATQVEPQTEALLEGAARLFAGWPFRNERGHDLARIPVDLKQLLLEQALESADEDKRGRANVAFA